MLGVFTADVVSNQDALQCAQTIFAGAGNAFDPRGGGLVFALADDGRAWRIKDTFVETSKNPDDWYTCGRKPGLRPERSGIPWRGFGKAWCDNSQMRDALGFAKIYGDVDANFPIAPQPET